MEKGSQPVMLEIKKKISRTFHIPALWDFCKNILFMSRWLMTGKRRILIFLDKMPWALLDYYRLANMCLRCGYRFIEMPDFNKFGTKQLAIDEKNFRSFSYKGVKLFDVSIYGICVELEIFPTELSFSKTEHRRKIEEWYGRSASYIDRILSLFEKNRIFKAVTWQGYFSDGAIIKAISIMKDLPIITFENTSNRLKLVWDDVSGITVNKNLASNYFWKYEKLTDTSVAENYVKGNIINIQKLKVEDHFSPDNRFIKKTSRPLIVFIGQVYTDASVLFGINAGFKEPVEIIESLAEYAASNDFKLAVKLHPKEAGGLNTITSRPYEKITWRKICNNSSLKAKIESSGNITVDHDNLLNTYSMLNNADVVVTINSQAGLEALALGKNVILCGQCFYGNIGSTFNAQNTNMLKAFLDMVLKEKITLVDKTKIDKFFYIYFEKYCIDKNESAVRDLILRKL